GFLAVSFIPVGAWGIRPPVWICLAGISLSAGVEALQTWIPGRYPSLSDVLLNGAGALCGALWAGNGVSVSRRRYNCYDGNIFQPGRQCPRGARLTER